jgi:hypothetical protein
MFNLNLVKTTSDTNRGVLSLSRLLPTMHALSGPIATVASAKRADMGLGLATGDPSCIALPIPFLQARRWLVPY